MWDRSPPLAPKPHQRNKSSNDVHASRFVSPPKCEASSLQCVFSFML
nr:MAG TPA: hypothetical protein [Caudoviricetes sp.]